MPNYLPAVSVVMPVFNTPAPFLKEAVDSILDQSFRDFEFIIVDDGSGDETREYLDGLTDPRIRIIRSEKNLGVTRSLNIGFRAARGKYVARMDGDDVSTPDRLEKQFAFMEAHPDVVVCGCEVSRRIGDTLPVRRRAEDMESYRIRMLFSNPGPVHPTAFFRREVLLRYKIEYNESLRYAQDYDMYMTVSQYGAVCRLPDKLLFYRSHEGQVSRAHREEQILCDKETQKKLLSRLLDHVTERELDLHYRYSTGYYPDASMSFEVIKWYGKLLRANDRKGVYNRVRFRIKICRILLRPVRRFWNSVLSKMRR